MASKRKALLAFAALLLSGAPTLAQEDVAAFFKARRCASSSASASDPATTSMRGCWRATWPRISRAIPIIVQNQPGAGSLTMTNALYNTGPYDGTVMGASFNGMPTTPLLQPAARASIR